MIFTTADLDKRICDIDSIFKNKLTLRQWLHKKFISIFGRDCNDDKLNRMSSTELTKLIYDFDILTDKISKKDVI